MQFGPIVRMSAAIAVLSVMDAVIKGMAAYYPVFQVAFLRFLCGSVIAVGAACILRPGWPSRETVVANSMRAVVAVVTALSFFYALSQLPLAETLLRSFLAPLFIQPSSRLDQGVEESALRAISLACPAHIYPVGWHDKDSRCSI